MTRNRKVPWLIAKDHLDDTWTQYMRALFSGADTPKGKAARGRRDKLIAEGKVLTYSRETGFGTDVRRPGDEEWYRPWTEAEFNAAVAVTAGHRKREAKPKPKSETALLREEIAELRALLLKQQGQ